MLGFSRRVHEYGRDHGAMCYSGTGGRDWAEGEHCSADRCVLQGRPRSTRKDYHCGLPRIIDKPAQVTGQDDAAKAEWFPLSALPELAFDHADIMADAINFTGYKAKIISTIYRYT